MIHSGDSGENNSPLEIPAGRGFSVSYKGKTLLSRVDPVSQAERLTAELQLKEKTLYLCPSPLYGYGLSQLLQKLKPDSAILCVEADEKLFELSRNAMSGISAIASKNNAASFTTLALVRETKAENLCVFIGKTWGKRFFRRVETIRLTGGWQLFSRLYNDFEEVIRREIAVEWGNAMTMIRLGRLYSKNLIRNLALPFEREPLNFHSAPVLALGAGPSLDPLLDELSRLFGGKIPEPPKRRFKIVCADTCLPSLNEREITPDLAVILESQHWNLKDFIGLQGREIDAALDLSSLPASARVLGGKRFFYATFWTEMNLLKRLEKEGLLPETIPPMGSVGLNAVELALRLSTGLVITGGLDFSYTIDAFHARSTAGHRDLLNSSNRFKSLIAANAAFREGSFAAISKSGKQTRSNPALRNYRDLFEQEFGRNQQILDIIGSGLNLGVKTVSPQEAFLILEGKEKTAVLKTEIEIAHPHAWNRMDVLTAFIRREIDTLETLKEILTGSTAEGNPGGDESRRKAPSERLESLLDTADYLWAHFPECAGGSRRPPCTDISFLKRVRVEIDPFLKLWEMTLRECVAQA